MDEQQPVPGSGGPLLWGLLRDLHRGCLQRGAGRRVGPRAHCPGYGCDYSRHQGVPLRHDPGASQADMGRQPHGLRFLYARRWRSDGHVSAPRASRALVKETVMSKLPSVRLRNAETLIFQVQRCTAGEKNIPDGPWVLHSRYDSLAEAKLYLANTPINWARLRVFCDPNEVEALID